MGYKVKVTRMVEYDELTKDERIKLALSTKGKKLQYILSQDENPEVRAALLRNRNISEDFIYERLINDSSEEVKSALKTLYKDKSLREIHWVVYHFAMILFGKLPQFDNIEQRRSLMAFIYLSWMKADIHIEDIFFGRGDSYYPYSMDLDYFMRVTSNVYMVLPEKIKTLEYEFGKTAQQQMDDLWQTINKEKPSGIELEKWISSIGRVHLILQSNISSSFRNGDKLEQLAYKFVKRYF